MEAAQAEGVTSEGASPEPVVDSPTTEAGGVTAEAKPGEEETLPFGKHPRWQKMVKERRELEAKHQQTEQELASHKDLIEFGNFLKANPQKAKKILEILEAREEAAAEGKDPYADYDPDVAARFKSLDELKQWKADQERQRQEQETQATQTVQRDIDTEFDQRLIKDGFLGEDGTPKNEKVVNVFTSATKSFLDQIAKDPKRPTRAEFDAAYKDALEVYNGLREEFSREALNNAAPTHVPATGSGKGAPPAGKTSKTAHDRIMDIANSI